MRIVPQVFPHASPSFKTSISRKGKYISNAAAHRPAGESTFVLINLDEER